MKIEHRLPQNKKKYKDLVLDYKNLFGVCKGGEGNPPEKQHCDTHKSIFDAKPENEFIPLEISPLNKSHINQIEYKKSGEIFSKNEKLNRDITDVLNLNNETLKIARQITITEALKHLSKKHEFVTWTKKILQKEIDIWNETIEENKLRPYNEVVIFDLHKRMKSI